MLLTKINGHTRFFRHLSAVRRVPGSHTEWIATRYGVDYAIFGGKAAGGTRRDWWIDGPTDGHWPKPVPCTSLVDCLNVLDNM